MAMAGGGGGKVTFAQVETDLEMYNCTGCHGTGGVGAASLLLSAGDAANNYTNFTRDAQNGAMSLVLTENEPVANGGKQHSGGNTLFAMTTSPIYVRWLAWINAGNPQ